MSDSLLHGSWLNWGIINFVWKVSRAMKKSAEHSSPTESSITEKEKEKSNQISKGTLQYILVTLIHAFIQKKRFHTIQFTQVVYGSE